MTVTTEPLAAWEIELADSLRVDVDLTKDVPCSWTPIDGCTQAAAFILVVPCGHETFHCTKHKHQVDEVYLTYVDPRCAECYTPAPDYTWRPI